MHIVAANSDTSPRLHTVLTARADSECLAQLLPGMEYADVLSSPGPARVVSVELSTGHPASVVFHERKHFIEILAPLEAGIEAGLAELLAELEIGPGAVTWTHDRVDRHALFAGAETVARVQ